MCVFLSTICLKLFQDLEAEPGGAQNGLPKRILGITSQSEMVGVALRLLTLTPTTPTYTHLRLRTPTYAYLLLTYRWASSSSSTSRSSRWSAASSSTRRVIVIVVVTLRPPEPYCPPPPQILTTETVHSIRLVATHATPDLTVAKAMNYHLFLSHAWLSAQDQNAVIKRQLLHLLPGVSVFLE